MARERLVHDIKSFENRVTLIAGDSQGIREAIGAALAAQGCIEASFALMKATLPASTTLPVLKLPRNSTECENL